MSCCTIKMQCLYPNLNYRYYLDSDLDPAKRFGFCRIRIRILICNTALFTKTGEKQFVSRSLNAERAEGPLISMPGITLVRPMDYQAKTSSGDACLNSLFRSHKQEIPVCGLKLD
jgi:hypothetical protein